MGVVNNFAANSVISFVEKKAISLLLCKISLGICNDCVGLEVFFDISINFHSIDYFVIFLLNLEKHKCTIIY